VRDSDPVVACGAVNEMVDNLGVAPLRAEDHLRGARVRLVSEREAVEILETRAVLEGLAARLAAERANAQDVEDLKGPR